MDKNMLKIITLAALATINCISYAHPDHGVLPPEQPSDHPEHPSDHPEHPSDHPEHPSKDAPSVSDSAAVAKQVKALLSEAHKAYKNADGITETLTLTFPSPMGEEETMTVALTVGETSGTLEAKDQATFVWADGNVYGVLGELNDSYVEVEATDGFFAGMNTLIDGGGGMPSWSLALRESDDYDIWTSSFNIFGLPEMTATSVESKEVNNANVELITYTGPAGRLEVAVNDKKQIASVTSFMMQPGGPEMSIPIVAEVSFDKVTTKSTFDPGDRKKYDSIDAMVEVADGGSGEPKPKLQGNTAPDFTLARMDGSGDVTLSDLKGQVVLLDFWATWCTPCKRGLPGLNKLDEWVQSEDLQVQIFAVNVWEEGKSDIVKKFWADNEYKTKVLMGSADKKLTDNYQISGIPLTAIIGPDGNIFEMHSGFTAGMDEKLKKSILAALGAPEKPDHPDHPEKADHPKKDHPDHPSKPDHPDHPN